MLNARKYGRKSGIFQLYFCTSPPCSGRQASAAAFRTPVLEEILFPRSVPDERCCAQNSCAQGNTFPPICTRQTLLRPELLCLRKYFSPICARQTMLRLEPVGGTYSSPIGTIRRAFICDSTRSAGRDFSFRTPFIPKNFRQRICKTYEILFYSRPYPQSSCFTVKTQPQSNDKRAVYRPGGLCF